MSGRTRTAAGSGCRRLHSARARYLTAVEREGGWLTNYWIAPFSLGFDRCSGCRRWESQAS
jgi:hypothetical protein